ncbi:MAG: hypothetical protein KGI11_09560 [Thaumarchaeota archaeon]|nr:hypothetical protein [Nitrososphaerota archaeon]
MHQYRILSGPRFQRLKPRQVLVIPQSIGTLLSEDARTGIVLSIGRGTTELVLFEDLAYLEHEKNIADRKKIDALTTILANKLAVFKTELNMEYDVYVSGGGALVNGLYQSLQAKIHDNLKIVKEIPCIQTRKDSTSLARWYRDITITPSTEG